MKKIITLFILITTLIGCTNQSDLELVCVSDDINPITQSREKIKVNFNKKIETSNNFSYHHCGDSKEFILGSQNDGRESCVNHTDDGTNSNFRFNKKTGEIFFIWWKTPNSSSPSYTFSGKCEVDTNLMSHRKITIKTSEPITDSEVQKILDGK